MVLYFSATGNTEFIAKELASRLGDECINLVYRIKADNFEPVFSEKPYIICAPIYVCGIPGFMAEYLKKLQLDGNRNVYFIFTSGGYCGPAGVLAKKIIKSKKMIYKGHAEFKMPRNYVANDSYPMLPKDETEKRIRDAYVYLSKVAEDIAKGEMLTARHVSVFETMITVPFNPVWCKYKLTAKDFYATDACIGCGKCEKLCPLNNVKLSEDKKPVWKNSCTHCMACIANCPVNAVEYGTLTKDKERYTLKKYQYVIDELSK